jgi:hypothetical protein
MSRDIPTIIADSINANEVSVFWACDLLFDSPNEIYFWSGIGDLELDGNTYTGAGDLISISEIRESSDIAAYGAQLTLSGIPNELVELALQEPYQGRKANVRFGVVTPPSTYTVFTVFSGEMDQMDINMGPETTTISLDVESRLIDLERPRIRRYTDGDQRARFPNDRGLEFLTRLQSESLNWEAS